LILPKIGCLVNFLVVSDDWTTANFEHCIVNCGVHFPRLVVGLSSLRGVAEIYFARHAAAASFVASF